MTYTRLLSEHAAIEAAMADLVSVAERDTPAPADAAEALERLATIIRDHVAGEDEVVYTTVLRARGGRHAELAERAAADLERLTDDWIGYLYRWNAATVATDWPRFAAETTEMVPRIRDRLMFETTILYSLALHHQVIGV